MALAYLVNSGVVLNELKLADLFASQIITISTDQIILTQPGLVPQDAGRLSNERITAATVFVDHFSSYSYVVVMASTTGEETLRAKQEFEAHATSLRIRVSHYHADNGHFKEPIFMDDVQLNAQTISFCGVNAHHQNGIIERHTLTDSARMMLLHAEWLWPEAVTQILWPFALKYTQHLHNYLSLDTIAKCPFHQFSNADASILDELDMADFHTFGSPSCYVLDSATHNPKWDPRSSLCIFVGFSPDHARNVAMVLNPYYTGLVSTQYHIVFDDHFQTLKALRDTTVPDSWTTLYRLNSTLS